MIFVGQPGGNIDLNSAVLSINHYATTCLSYNVRLGNHMITYQAINHHSSAKMGHVSTLKHSNSWRFSAKWRQAICSCSVDKIISWACGSIGEFTILLYFHLYDRVLKFCAVTKNIIAQMIYISMLLQFINYYSWVHMDYYCRYMYYIDLMVPNYYSMTISNISTCNL